MMRLLFAVLSAGVLASCDKPMANDEIIATVKMCAEAGMSSVDRFIRPIDLKTVRIECSLRSHNEGRRVIEE